MIFYTHFIPETLSGWAVLVASFAAVAGTIVSSIMFVMKKMLETLEAKLDGVRLNQQENTDATLRAVERVHQLEITINNGLTHRTQQTADDVEEIKKCQQDLATQMSEIHGWLKAMQQRDGDDRRA